MKRTKVISSGLAVVGALLAGYLVWLNVQVAQIERTVRLPATASALDTYARYYWAEVDAGSVVVVGHYLGSERPGVRLRPTLITKMDGGCGVIKVRYAPEVKRVLSTACNGVA